METGVGSIGPEVLDWSRFRPGRFVSQLPITLPNMRPPAPNALLARAEKWEDLSRWERAEIGRALRLLGWSYSEIRSLIPVPKATLSGWCAGIELTLDQVDAIRARTSSQEGVPRDTQWRRRREIQEIRAAAAAEVPLLVAEPLWVAGTTMYWAEGSKTHRRLALTNSDPSALRLFVVWTTTYLNADSEFVGALHLHHGNDEAEAKRFWMDAVGLADLSFHKTYVKPPGTGHRKNHLAHGVCRLTVRRSADHLVRVSVWFDNLPAVLDL